MFVTLPALPRHCTSLGTSRDILDPFLTRTS